jgi:hypothetical protein
MYVKEIWREDVELLHMAVKREQRLSVANAEMFFRSPR